MKTETYVCQSCGADVVRPVVRGQRPKWCPDCRAIGVRPQLCKAACGARVKRGRGYCSQRCFNFAERGVKAVYFPECLNCGTLFAAREPDRFVCSAVCYREADKATRAGRPEPIEWRTERECPGCGGRFCPIYTPHQLACSHRCSRRVARWRRRASEAGAPGTWIWSDFMRIAARFDFRCAYCGEKPDGPLDPDHVVPLSKGGDNSATNLLPACHTCNGQKRDLLLVEWEAERIARGLPPRMTSWPTEDKRYWHLCQARLVAAAA